MLWAKLFTFVFVLIGYCCITPVSSDERRPTDCQTLRARCHLCMRSINEGPDEDNMFGRLNRRCQDEIGRQYAWKNLFRCDMIYLRCKGINSTLDCTTLARLSNMPRRLS